ncbi:polyamine transporter 1 [Trichomonascus vanleenenianus]|uniref:MFS transporter n=1 Tax=Trichomonascus vanleenenianus TaxID=2268995 RepID=UPI003ECB0FBD
MSDRSIDEEKQVPEPVAEASHASTTGSLGPDDYIVIFEEKDPQNPKNWPFFVKAYHTFFYSLTTFAAQYNSAAMSSVIKPIEQQMGVSRTVALLSTSLYVFGVAFGPMLFAPLSEVYGRKKGIVIPFAISGIFTLGTASSKNISAILCTRFFSGLFAGAPVVSSGGVLADLWLPAQRGTALSLYAYFVAAGTMCAPTISAVLFRATGHWQWSCWFASMLFGIITAIDGIFLRETYAPIILTNRARKLRHSTGNWLYHSKHEEWELTVKEFTHVHLVRPFAMLATPIVFCMALFASYVFGILYLTVTSIPYTFQVTRGWDDTVSTYPTMAMFIGAIVGSWCNIWGSTRYARVLEKNGGKPVPEERIHTMMVFGWLMPAGIFIFAWTSRPEIHWFVPVLGIALSGLGFFTIFQGCLNYLVDTFTSFSASAIAANTFCRSIFGAVFAIIGHYLFENLGVHWGASLIGFIALGMIVIPFFFYFYGARIRARNPFVRLVENQHA